MPKLKIFLKEIGYYFPFTKYLLAFFMFIYLGYKWIKKLSLLQDSSYKDIFSLLLHVSIYISLAILFFGFITIAVSFIYFVWQNYKGKLDVSFNTTRNDSSEKLKQEINISINPVLKPFMGFLRFRVYYGYQRVSDKITPGYKSVGSLHFSGFFNWHLPEIREYQINKVIIYFEDFFNFFSFAIPVYTSKSFYLTPTAFITKEIMASNRITKELKTRIDELKRVEGELINYKNFETSDDVRRIVWKIYAKNKELTVRIPEILDPYASDLHIYASFYSKFDSNENEIVNTAFQNYYKNSCWSIYCDLEKQGLSLKFITDQPIPEIEFENKNDAVKHIISLSSWQKTTNIHEFVKPKQAAVLIISSLSDSKAIKEFVENHGSQVLIVYVPLSTSLKQNKVKEWLTWFFVADDTNLFKKIRWRISPLRLNVTENEEAIERILDKTIKTAITMRNEN